MYNFDRLRPVVAGAAVVLVAVALLSVVLATGCSSSRPENSPYIKSKFAEIDEQLKDFAALKRDMTLLQDDIKYFEEELANLRSIGGAGGISPEQLKDVASLNERVIKIEQMAGDLTKIKAEAERLQKSVASAPPSNESSSTPAGEAARRAAPAPSKPAATVAAPTRNTVPTSNSATKRVGGGFYYRVQKADTIANVAAANGVSTSQLAKANNLPENARLNAGQRLWIP